ncbi:MAG TPA: DUF883 family protein [Casimicrobiaceae bacterium]|nr:DUF883 family protein [Casimicrobiaceae bacterium]
MAESDTMSRDNVVDEVSSAVSDAQDMLRRANAETGERARELRSQVEGKLLRAKLRLQELQGQAIDSARAAANQAMDRGRAAARVTDDYVRENPWQVLGAAALIGLLIGIVVARSGSDD